MVKRCPDHRQGQSRAGSTAARELQLDMAMHIPWMGAPPWQVNPEFVDKVRKALHERTGEPVEQTLIMAICRSGTHSRLAAEELARHGFSRVFNIADGGWRYRGLPWEQS